MNKPKKYRPRGEIICPNCGHVHDVKSRQQAYQEKMKALGLCTQCGKTVHKAGFCEECYAKHRAYQITRRYKLLQYQKEWRAKNKDKVRAYQQACQKANKERNSTK